MPATRQHEAVHENREHADVVNEGVDARQAGPECAAEFEKREPARELRAVVNAGPFAPKHSSQRGPHPLRMPYGGCHGCRRAYAAVPSAPACEAASCRREDSSTETELREGEKTMAIKKKNDVCQRINTPERNFLSGYKEC